MQFFAILAFLSSVAAAFQLHAVHERRDLTPPSWSKRSRLPVDLVLPMRIGLSQRNLNRGHDLLMSVSDPSSPNYSKHWTAKEVADMFAPARETVDAVRKWLADAGIADERIQKTADRSWVGFDATVKEAEELFRTEYWAWEFKGEDGLTTVACDEYQVPQHIQRHIDYIKPGIKLSVPFSQSRRFRRDVSGKLSGSRAAGFKSASESINSVEPLSSCDVVITPQCIAALYEIPPGGKSILGNNLGIYERGDFVSNTSLDLFFANFTHIPQGTRPTRVNIDGLSNYTDAESDSHGEADLDFQLAYPIVYPQNITQYQTDDIYYSGYGSNMYDGLFNTFLDALDGSYCNYSAFGETGDDPAWDPIYPNNHTIGDLPPEGDYMGPLQCGLYKPTNVISFSYGHAENTYPAAYEKRQCNEFMKLGLQGVSLIISSGDRGVSEDLGCLGPNATIFSPTYPGNCPYVTTVGATKVYPGKSVFDPESAVYDPDIDYASGGGFSNVYDRPKYQNDAIENYFRFHNPPYPYYEGNASMGVGGGLYNRIGRGIPDVAANGDNIATYVEGQFTLGAGTSASTPIFASIINRINGERLAIGKKPLGFLNPALYSNPSMLNDITNGTNPGCGTNGFSTAPGWDPVTGLGTPNYPKMLAYFMALP